MIGEQVGPYRIESELGAGGMGTVYLAEVTSDAPGTKAGEKVALKVVHPHLLATPGFFKRFLREAELGKKVKQENVVRTFDVDATLVNDRQVNYMAMEYVEGRSLRELLVDLGTVPEALLHEIAVQSAAGLAAIHACDIVHRDLKPENVLITGDDQVRIMDLGVAKLAEASIAITKEGQFAGSLLYAAPEQFNEHGVGPRSDLYSLGVMLYELATGKNPFRRDDAAAVISAHLNAAAPRATDLNPELSAYLTEVLAALLEKNPDDRLASAAFLSTLLEEGESSAWWGERAAALRKTQKQLPRIPVRRETGLHGRESELECLQKAWERAKQGHGSAVLIDGEAGLGKSRLVDAFLRKIADEDAHILYGSYPPSGGLGGLSQSILDKFGATGLAESLTPYLTVTPSLVPAFAALLRHESPPTGSAPLSGDVQHTVFSHLLRALGQEKPTIWVLEDLHFASEDSRKVVLTLANAASEHRVLLIPTARVLPEQELVHFGALDGFQRISLGRLSPRQVVELLRDAFHSEQLADRLGAKIAYKSDGVPFFVFEMLRSLKEKGFIKAQADGSYVVSQQITDIEVPSAVKDLIEARLREITENQRSILDVGAVQGYAFDPDLVARVLEEKRVRVLRDLAELERRFGIVRGESGASRFDQYQIQEVLYRDLPPDLRAEYHALLAEAFAERDGVAGADDTPGETAYFLASHFLRGKRPKSAAPYVKPALAHLRQAYRNDAALELVDLALGGMRLDDRGRTEFLIDKAECLSTLGRPDQAGAMLDDALEKARGIGDRELETRVLWQLAQHYWGKSQFEHARDTVHSAMANAREMGDRGAAIRGEHILGNICREVGRYDEASGHFERAIEISEEQGDANRATLATVNLGDIFFPRGCYDKALELAQRGLEMAKACGNSVGEAVATANLGIASTHLGRSRRAREHLEDYLGIARRIGERRLEGSALHYLAVALSQQGEDAAAEHLFQQALTLRKEIQYQKGVAESLVALGRHLLARDRVVDAFPHLKQAARLGESLDLPDPIVLALAYLARLPEGDAAKAREALDKYRDRLAKSVQLEVHFLLWKAAANPEDLAEAHRLLEFIRANSPEEDRESMVANVPLYRDIMAAWAEHGASA